MNEVTEILSRIEREAGVNGEGTSSAAAGELLPLIYQELRQLAAARMAHERPGQTLSATALVHEAYVRLLGDGSPRWDSRGHFFAAAAEAMRRILVDNARRKRRPKHGGDRERLDVDDAPAIAAPELPADHAELLALDEALTRFAAEDPVKAELVKLRYFAGLSLEDTALAMDISAATAKRYWAYARAWLHAELSR